VLKLSGEALAGEKKDMALILRYLILIAEEVIRN